MTTPSLEPRLVVDDAAAAIDFYIEALDAVEIVRYAEPSGKIVHAEMRVGDDIFSLTEADGGHNRSPLTIGGSALILTLVVEDADSVGEAFVAAGAEVIIPIADQYYGRREGRLRDPYGHLWIISQAGDELSRPEIQERVDRAADVG